MVLADQRQRGADAVLSLQLADDRGPEARFLSLLTLSDAGGVADDVHALLGPAQRHVGAVDSAEEADARLPAGRERKPPASESANKNELSRLQLANQQRQQHQLQALLGLYGTSRAGAGSSRVAPDKGENDYVALLALPGRQPEI